MAEMKKTQTESDALVRFHAFVTACGSQKAAAARLGVTQQYICDILKGRRGLSQLILDELGLKRVVLLVSK